MFVLLLPITVIYLAVVGDKNYYLKGVMPPKYELFTSKNTIQSKSSTSFPYALSLFSKRRPSSFGASGFGED
jgi:hypothetical protein